MSDEADLAQLYEQARRDNALARVRNATEGIGREDCIGCEAPIPAARRKAVRNCIRCIDCQEDYERQERKRVRGR